MDTTGSALQLNLLNIGYSDLNADWNWKDVYSPFARLYFVTGGSAKTYINGCRYDLEPGYLYLTPPFTLHHDECDTCFSLYYIHFYEKAIRKESIFDRYDFPVSLKASPLEVDLIERLHEINPDRQLTNIDPKQYDNHSFFSRSLANSSRQSLHEAVETQSILSILMSRFLKERKRRVTDMNLRIHKAIQHIHVCIDQEISSRILAGISCVSEDHFIRLFKKETGMTPVRYIHAKKIENAQLLLLTTDRPVREIALELAIDNISYFNKLFKKTVGKTPTEYRKEYGRH